MGRQGYLNILVTEETHNRLSVLKAKMKKKSFNELIKELIKLTKD